MPEHPWGVGMPAWIKLHHFAEVLRQAFGVSPVLVGSALRTKRPRDVDIRVELPDREYHDTIGPIRECNVPGTKWAAICLAFSALGKEMTGRPIDFQVQPFGVSWAYRDEPRITLGPAAKEDPVDA